MRRCPKCGRTFDNDRQKFCTLDGTGLLDVEVLDEAEAQRLEQGETIRIDSSELNSAELHDEMTKIISREPPPQSLPSFDPYKTVVSESGSTSTAPPPTAPQAPSSAAPPTEPPIQAPPAATTSVPPPAESPDLMRTIAAVSPPVQSAPLPSEAPPAPPVQPPVAEASAVQPQPQPPPMHAAAPKPKRSKVPLVLGILAVLFIFAIVAAGAGYWFLLRPYLAKRAVVVEPERPTETPTPRTTPAAATPTPKTVQEVPPYNPPSDAVEFVNSKDKLNGKLAEHYVDFSFYYPERWQKDPKAGAPGATNFAKVQSQLAPDAPQEIFAIGWYESTGAKETDQLSFPRLVAQRSADFAHQYPEYQKISEGATKVGPYEGYEFRFSGVYRNTERGDINIWGRVIFLPPLEGKNGVTLLMLASSLTSDVKSADDVGVKGELPMTLESFRFGK